MPIPLTIGRPVGHNARPTREGGTARTARQITATPSSASCRPTSFTRSQARHQEAGRLGAATLGSTPRCACAGPRSRGRRAPRFAYGPVKQRSIYDAGHAEQSTGTLVRAEGQAPTGDVAVNEAYDGLGATWDFYHQIFGRNSIDGQGMRARTPTVHYGQDYDNAFWDGQRDDLRRRRRPAVQPFTISIDVIGHELTHGVTGSEADLVYHDQPGALNESICDVFGSLVKQYGAGPDRRRRPTG